MSEQVQRVERYWLSPNATLGKYCHHSKGLFNEANWLIKTWLDKTGTWLRYGMLNWLMKDVRQSRNYKELPAQTAQQILITLDKSWTSFFRSIKDWKMNPEKYQAKPEPPKFKKRSGEHTLFFTKQQTKFQQGFVTLPKIIGIHRKITLLATTLVNGARIKPYGVGYLLEVIYTKNKAEIPVTTERQAAIDLGLNNLIIMVNKIGLQPIAIKGEKIKALNQWFNKQLAKLRHIYDKTKVRSGQKIIIRMLKRKRQLEAWFHKISRYIVNWCIEHNIEHLIVGYNEQWKQNINIGRRNNQNFVQIPFYNLLYMLRYKCEDAGLEFTTEEEAYTSKCSFLDLETIEKHEQYVGRRIKRGMFRSGQGILINADVNAAYNILRKVSPHAIDSMLTAEGLVDAGFLKKTRGLHPKRVQVV